MSVRLELGRVCELSREDLDAWSSLVESEDRWASPFFHPQYHRVLDESLRDVGATPVEVVLARVEGRVAAFFPFQRESRRRGGPPSGRMSDYHGIVGEIPDLPIRAWLKAAQLDEWRFHHVPVEQAVFDGCHVRSYPSPQIDLGSTTADRLPFHGGLARAERVLARDLGPLRFDAATTGGDAFSALARWKSAQYLRSGKRDLFAERWAVHFLHRLRDDSDIGRLAVLRAGETIVAAHFGLATDRALHYWLPAYDPGSARSSPGMLLLRRIVDQSFHDGLSLIDFGRGDEPYKLKLSNRCQYVGIGAAQRGLGPRLKRIARPVLRGVRRGGR